MKARSDPSQSSACHSWFKELGFAAILLLLLLCIAPDELAAEERSAPRVLILEHGLYRADSIGRLDKPGTIDGLRRVRNARLLQNTTLVPARKFVRFGVRYVVLGAIGGAVPLRMITKFPAPGLINPTSGTVYPRNEYVISRLAGQDSYRHYRLEEDWEVVPGLWTFEFWHEDRLLETQTFCVYPEDSRQASSRPACSLLLSQLY